MKHLRLDPMCDCYNRVENAEHYLFKCYRFSDLRITLFRATKEFLPLNIDRLFFGSAYLTFDQTNYFLKPSRCRSILKQNTKRF